MSLIRTSSEWRRVIGLLTRTSSEWRHVIGTDCSGGVYSPILRTWRHPNHVPVSNSQDTAPPRGHAAQQSPWHNTPTSKKKKRDRNKRKEKKEAGRKKNRRKGKEREKKREKETIIYSSLFPFPLLYSLIFLSLSFSLSLSLTYSAPSNPHDTVPHTPHARHVHRHSLPLRSTAQRRTRDTFDAVCRCVPRNVRSKSSHSQIHGFSTPATVSQRPTRARTREPRKPAILATAHDSLRLPRGFTVQCLAERHQCIRSPTPATP